MKKKIFAVVSLILVLVMAVSLAGCKSNTDAGSSNPPSDPSSSAPDNSSAPSSSQSEAPPPSSDVPPADLPTYDFTFAHPFPAQHHHNVQIIEPLVKELYDKSNGRINITIVPGGSITTGTSAVDDITTGAVDMTWTLQGYTAGRFPLTDMIEFADHFTSAQEATAVIWDLLESNAEFQKEYSDYKLFNIYTADMGDIWNNVKPITKPSDLSGISLRSASPMVELTLKAYGANTANMPMPETYDNIDRGVVNGLGTGSTAIPTYKLYEVVKYGTQGLNLYASPQMMAMSWNAWNKLAPEDQALFEECTGRALGMKSAQVYDSIAETSFQEVVKQGVEIYTLSDAEKAAFLELSNTVIAPVIESLNSKGYDAQGFYDQMIAFRDARR